MNLSNLLIKSRVRENSGSRTDERYNYQKDLSLFMMIEYYKKENDYVFLFDFHDDLVVIDSAKNPNNIKFFQIKTKTQGNWTISRLIKVEKGENSYLGKLYNNKIIFKDYVSELCFLSNAKYNFDMNNGDNSENKYEIRGKELDNSCIDKINSKLKEEFSLAVNPNFENITTFRVSKLSLSDSKTHCKGALTEILDYLNSDKTPNINLTYNKIFNEIRIKTDFVVEDYSIDNIEELISKKGISKSYFTSILIEANDYKSIEDEWKDIEQKLNSNGVGFLTIRTMKAKFRELSILLINSPNNVPLLETYDYIVESVNNYCNNRSADSENMNYNQLMEAIYDQCSSNLPYKHFDNNLIKTIILKKLAND